MPLQKYYSFAFIAYKTEVFLPSGKFMRVHRSYMVNLSKITAVAHNRIIFGKEVYIPIGSQYKDKFMQYLDTRFLGK